MRKTVAHTNSQTLWQSGPPGWRRKNTVDVESRASSWRPRKQPIRPAQADQRRTPRGGRPIRRGQPTAAARLQDDTRRFHVDPVRCINSSNVFPVLSRSRRPSPHGGRQWLRSGEPASPAVPGRLPDHSRCREPPPRRAGAPRVSSRCACRVPEVAKEPQHAHMEDTAMQTGTMRLRELTVRYRVRKDQRGPSDCRWSEPRQS